MDHMKILRRAWDILRSYRALWVFGFILALTTASGGNNFNFGNGNSSNNNIDSTSEFNFEGLEDVEDEEDLQAWFDSVEKSPDFQEWVDNLDPEFQELFESVSLFEIFGAVFVFAIALIVIAIVLSIVFAIARYVAETSVMKMVNHYEETSEALSFGQGFRLGWSREAWRIFVVDLVTIVPVVVLVAAPVAALVSMLVTFDQRGIMSIPAVVAGVLALLIFVLLAIILGLLLTLLKHFVWREITLNGQRIGPAFREGYAMLRGHLKDVGLMWLIMVGLNIAWQIAFVPVAIIVVLIAAIVGLIIFLITGGVSLAFASGGTNWIVGGAVALLFFIPLVAMPLTVIQGFLKIYVSSIWTLTYRELDILSGHEVVSAV